ILRLQRTIGNQALQRYLNTPTATTPIVSRVPSHPLLQRGKGDEKLDSRVEAQKTDDASMSCGVAKRKVVKQEKKRGPTDPFGSTASKLYIDYSVDEDDKVTLSCLRPEFVITIFTPYITS